VPTEEPFVISFPIEPLDGMFGETPPGKIPVGGSPDMSNCYVRGDTLRKRPGYSILGNQVHASQRIMGLFSAFDEDDNVFLFAATQTGIKRYSPGSDVWTAYTGPTLSGGSERKFSWDVSQNSVVFCNGVDQVQRIPFTGTSYAILNANCPAARFLTRFADRLYLASTVEGSATKPFRVRRSVNGDHTDWTGLGSGFTDLSEYPYHIEGLAKTGSQLLIPTTETVWLATRTGIAAAPARFDPVVPGTGLYSPFTLTPWQNDFLFMGRDHMYAYSGARITEIMQSLRDSIFFNVEASKVHMNFAVFRPEAQEWIAFTCEAGDATPTVGWVWNAHYNIGYRWDFTGPICATIHRQDVAKIWDALVGDWTAQTSEWTLSEATVNFPLMVTGHTNGTVYQWKEDTPADAGNPIACRWTSKDFSSSLLLEQRGLLTGTQQSLHQITLKGLSIEYLASGTTCTLNFYLSTDGGATWTSAIPVSLNASDDNSTGYYTATMSEQITGDRIRWKFEHSSATEKFRIARFIPEFEIKGLPLQHAA
jgi:hypothetical protein